MLLNAIALCLVLFSIITIILGIIVVHTYPAKIARARNHPQAKAIEVTSLLGLIAFPLWMLALIWAYSKPVVADIAAGLAHQGSDGPSGPTPEPSKTEGEDS